MYIFKYLPPAAQDIIKTNRKMWSTVVSVHNISQSWLTTSITCLWLYLRESHKNDKKSIGSSKKSNICIFCENSLYVISLNLAILNFS